MVLGQRGVDGTGWIVGESRSWIDFLFPPSSSNSDRIKIYV